MVRLLTGPFLVLLLVVPLFVAAAARHALRQAGRYGWLPGRVSGPEPGSRSAGATATGEPHALIYPGKRAQLEQRRIAAVLRDDEQDGAPRRAGIDLDAGTARFGGRAAGVPEVP
ncbi:DUF6191 domain-containing protein [Streptomyces sp. NPDC046876]|uniref:DUF6191 domain-containing protein n=1 Tax=Streptomyces sp. NPDC046876 TaxID=3155616 RepID=UPI0033FE278E